MPLRHILGCDCWTFGLGHLMTNTEFAREKRRQARALPVQLDNGLWWRIAYTPASSSADDLRSAILKVIKDLRVGNPDWKRSRKFGPYRRQSHV